MTKTLSKLKLSQAKVLKKEELINFQGGSSNSPCPTDECMECLGTCWGDVATDCDDLYDPLDQSARDACVEPGENWCVDFCSSGL